MMTEVEALKKSVAKAEEKAAAEQALREKHEARVNGDLGAEFNGERIRTHRGASGHERCPGGNPKCPARDPRGEEDRSE